MSARGPAALVIFDCDGVLIDSEVLACIVQARLFTAAGYEIGTEEVMRRFLGRSALDVGAEVESALGRPLPDTYPARSQAALKRVFRGGLKPVPGIPEIVARLRQAQQPICVASSSSPERLDLTLELVGLRSWFAPHIFSAARVERGKPAPDLFLHAAEQMGSDPDRCIVIEDSVPGIQAARAAGMTAIGFGGGSHCGPTHEALLVAAGAHLVARDAEELGSAIFDRAG